MLSNNFSLLAAGRRMYSDEQLVAFAQVVESGSFSQAARQLKRSQAAISQAISNLERGLGYGVFERQGKTVRLNDFGEQLYQLCLARRQAFQQLEALAEDARQAIESELTLYFTRLADHHALAPVLAQFHQQFGFTRLCWQRDWQQADLVIVAEDQIGPVREESAYKEFHWHLLTEITLLPVSGPLAFSSPRYIQVPWGPKSTEKHQLTAAQPTTALQMVQHNLGWTWIPEHLLLPLAEGKSYLPVSHAEPFTCRLLIGSRQTQGPAQGWLLERLMTQASKKSHATQ